MLPLDIKKLKSGNHKAQKEFYNAYADKLMFVISRYISTVSDQEEILHDVFLKIFSNLSRFDNTKASFDTWANRICVNTTINFLRKKKMITTQYNDIDKVKTIVNQAISKMNVDHLNLAIESLEEKYRLVFKLRAIEGYDYEEISQILDLKGSHVRKIFSRSKTKIQDLLNLSSTAVINTNY